MTKNITLAIDEDLLNRARVLAAMKRTTVNAMVREFLDREVRKEGDDAKRADAWAGFFRRVDSARPGPAHEISDDVKFDRDELHGEVLRERGLL